MKLTDTKLQTKNQTEPAPVKILKAKKHLADKLIIIKLITGKDIFDLTNEALELYVSKHKSLAKKRGYIL